RVRRRRQRAGLRSSPQLGDGRCRPQARGRTFQLDGDRRAHPRPVRVFALMNDIRIEPMSSVHAGQVLAIYQAGLDSGNASFETVAPDWSAWDAAHLQAHRFVAVDSFGVVESAGVLDSGRVLGWVAASAVSSRCVYAGVVEESVYVSPEA